MIESVPNLSEGRDLETIGSMRRAIQAAGARLLDVHVDGDHHRSVFTFVGGAEKVVAGVLAMAEQAIARIDIRAHHGEHPRIGAVDVVPFVPLADSSMADCISAAREAGEAIGARFGIPVYLYEAAASRPDRRNLADLRRGGPNGVATRIGTEGGRPDYGPARLHPRAGAIVVGARPFLVAYNVNLTSGDLRTARAIASSVRASGGGLPGVKALGVMLRSRGLAQVTMNLTDIDATTVPEAFEAVRVEAEQRGVGVFESEIVGLVPRAALAGASTDDLLLTQRVEEIILEERLANL